MIKCIIVDDEPLAIELLKSYISKQSDLQLVQWTTKSEDVLTDKTFMQCDVIFLDIEMPGLNGIDLLKAMDAAPRIIITSAYSEYALDGFEYNVVDYLLKPVSYSRFLKSIIKLKKALSFAGTTRNNFKSSNEFLFVKTDGRFIKVFFKDIFFIEGLKDYILIHLKDEKLISLESMVNMENTLPANQFLRVHKSFIINLSLINFVERNRIFIENHVIPIGEAYKNNLMNVIKGSH